MPTESLMPVFSSLTKRNRLTASINDTNFIEKLDETLQDAGWTQNAALIATGALDYPIGYPWVADATPGTITNTLTCAARTWLRVNGLKFIGYNPHDTNFVSGPCVFFPFGESIIESLDSLASAITANTSYIASASHISGSHYQISLIASGGGPAFNTQEIYGDGGYNTGASVLNGGYEWTSAGPASIYKVRCFATAKHFGKPYLHLNFQFTFNGSLSSYIWGLDIPAGATFTFIANPHGFGIWDPLNDNHFLYTTSIFAMAPHIPDDWSVPYSVFVVGDKCFRNSTAKWKNCQVALDSIGVKWVDGACPEPVMLRSAGALPVLTLAGVPWVQGPFIMMGPNSSSVPQVIGKLWDIVATNDYIAPGPIIIGGKYYEVLSSQTGAGNKTRSTLLWKYADVEV